MNIYAGNRGLVERIPENMPRIAEQRGYALRPTEDIPVRISEDKHEQTELIHKKNRRPCLIYSGGSAVWGQN